MSTSYTAKYTLKSGYVARQIGVTTQSIRRWSEEFREFLSNEYRQNTNYQALYTEDDVLLFATIHYLSTQGIHLAAIEERLRAGYRVSSESLELLRANNFIPPEEGEKILQESSLTNIQLQKITLERDYALEVARKAEEKQMLYEQEIRKLYQEMAELKHQLGIMEGELTILRRQQGQ